MYLRIACTVIAVATLFLISGCTKGLQDHALSSTLGCQDLAHLAGTQCVQEPGPELPGDPIEPVDFFALLQGHWQTECSNGTRLGLIFTGGDVEGYIATYSTVSTPCDRIEAIFRLVGPYALAGAMSGYSDAYKIDFTTNTATFDPRKTTAVNWFNGNLMCGLASWILRTEQDVLGLSCSAPLGIGLALTAPTAGTIHYNVIRVSQNFGTGQPELRLGEPRLGYATIVADRPVSLDPTVYTFTQATPEL